MVPDRVVVVVVLSCVFGAVLTHKKDPFAKVNEKCREEHQLSQEEFENLNNTRPIVTDDQKIKCFLKCVFVGMQVMNEEGDFTIEDEMHKNFAHHKYFSECKDVTGIDSCDKALNFKNCVWDKVTETENSG